MRSEFASDSCVFTTIQNNYRHFVGARIDLYQSKIDAIFLRHSGPFSTFHFAQKGDAKGRLGYLTLGVADMGYSITHRARQRLARSGLPAIPEMRRQLSKHR